LARFFPHLTRVSLTVYVAPRVRGAFCMLLSVISAVDSRAAFSHRFEPSFAKRHALHESLAVRLYGSSAAPISSK
jgi:hypothetical protein